MSELPISAWEAQWIINALWPAIKLKFFYGFHATIKANKDHIEIAFERLERDLSGVMDNILRDLLENGKQLPQWSEQLFKSIATVDGFEAQSEAIMNTPIVWELIELYILQDKDFQKILSRSEHAMDSFMKTYRKESLKYAESGVPNIKLLKKEREKLVKMTNLCMRDLQVFFNWKFIDLTQWLIIQSIKSPSPQNIDIKNLQTQFAILEQKDYYTDVTICFDRFFREMIDLITVE